jgi:hypothetical protein
LLSRRQDAHGDDDPLQAALLGEGVVVPAFLRNANGLRGRERNNQMPMANGQLPISNFQLVSPRGVQGLW